MHLHEAAHDAGLALRRKRRMDCGQKLAIWKRDRGMSRALLIGNFETLFIILKYLDTLSFGLHLYSYLGKC